MHARSHKKNAKTHETKKGSKESLRGRGVGLTPAHHLLPQKTLFARRLASARSISLTDRATKIHRAPPRLACAHIGLGYVCIHSAESHTCTQQQRWGGRVKSVYMFVSLSAFSSMAPLIGGRAAWSDDAMRQRQPMWCAILLSRRPSLIPASRPCLYVTAVMPAVSHRTGTLCCAVCVCINARVCAHMCVVALTNLFKPRPPCLYWRWWWRWRGKGAGPFERLPSFASIQPSSTDCSTAQLTSSSRQTEWIKGDTMRHLM